MPSALSATAGPGAVSERSITDVAAYFGFTIARVQDLPPSTRSISDVGHRVIYVPQRNLTGGTRSARSVIAQTLGHFALGHKDPADFEGYVRQRVEANYFAGAMLAPEKPVVRVLAEAKEREDISVEDLGEMFYISYEMAAHRLTNLITHHFGIPIHFQRSDAEGLLWKAYENDGVLLPSDADGTIEGQRLCRWWSSRQAFESEDSYSLHYQYTETVSGTFWCATHIGVERERGDAVTVGTVEDSAHWFRGSDTDQAPAVDLSGSGVLPPAAQRCRPPLGGGGLAFGPGPQPFRVGVAHRYRCVQPPSRGRPDRRLLLPRPSLRPLAPAWVGHVSLRGSGRLGRPARTGPVGHGSRPTPGAPSSRRHPRAPATRAVPIGERLTHRPTAVLSPAGRQNPSRETARAIPGPEALFGPPCTSLACTAGPGWYFWTHLFVRVGGGGRD